MAKLQNKSHESGLFNGKLYTGIVFDLDGVLFDTEPLHRLAWVNVFAELKLKVSKEELLDWTGIPCQQISAELEKRWNGRYSREYYYAAKDKHFYKLINSRTCIFQGVAEHLKGFSGNIPMAVASSSSRTNIELLLNNSGINQFFKYLVCYEDVKTHKPSPEAYLKAAALLDLNPENCIALEDSPSGCKAARTAGMLTLGIVNTFSHSELKMTDFIFSSTEDACCWIKENVFT